VRPGVRPGRLSPLCRADRYLLGLMLPRMAAALAITLMALLLERLLRLFDFVSGAGVSPGPVLGMALNLLPHYLGLALPVAFCVGLLGALARLSEDSEIDALEAAGWSLRRIGVPFLGCAVALAAVSLALFGYVQPLSRYAYYEIRNDVLTAGWNGRLQGGVFLDLGDELVLSAATADAGGRVLYRVFLQREQDGRPVAVTAARGLVLPEPDGATVRLVLEDGRTLLPDGERLDFDRLVVPREFDSRTGPFRPRGENARELTFSELWAAMRAAEGAPARRFAVELHDRLVRAVSLVGIALMSVPLAVARKRSPGWPRLALAIAALAIYDNLIKFVAGLGGIGQIDPALGLWGLALIFNGGALWLYLTHPGQGAEGPLRQFLRWIDRAPRRTADGHDARAAPGAAPGGTS
jgi:lipopolysaccharide export system permease protein